MVENWRRRCDHGVMKTTTAVGRGARGQFLPGHQSTGGRPALPDWFKSRAPDALLYLLDVATGVEPVEPELRLKAAALVVDRVYGKAPETLQVEGASAVMDLLVAMAKPVAPKE
jgi:hypothetical protein